MTLLRSFWLNHFDVVIVDQHGAGGSDGNIFPWLRSRSDRPPVLVLLPSGSPGLGALALDSGADDWMSQAFDPRELAARVNAISRRRRQGAPRRVIELRGFALDRDTSGFSFEGREIKLTRREFSIAWQLFSSPGVYISRKTLCTLVTGPDGAMAARTIDLHISKLRGKLRELPGQVEAAMTACGYGYRLEIKGKEAPLDEQYLK
ncbi:response regulator transcription factor [Herbaspirillum sp. RV1423]|uniref:response regulator transcription factor n=1 Tax=Herbaspirillum sp. RV1423 TaxID=1443993 RepID=UPI0004B3E173|nr:response regulator transcription factor [Herbaspirillum sp. RV1423]